jgi:hypothetical protein
MSPYISFLFVFCFATIAFADNTTNTPAKPPTGNVLYCAYVEKVAAGEFDRNMSVCNSQESYQPLLAFAYISEEGTHEKVMSISPFPMATNSTKASMTFRLSSEAIKSARSWSDSNVSVNRSASG